MGCPRSFALDSIGALLATHGNSGCAKRATIGRTTRVAIAVPEDRITPGESAHLVQGATGLQGRAADGRPTPLHRLAVVAQHDREMLDRMRRSALDPVRILRVKPDHLDGD